MVESLFPASLFSLCVFSLVSFCQSSALSDLNKNYHIIILHLSIFLNFLLDVTLNLFFSSMYIRETLLLTIIPGKHLAKSFQHRRIVLRFRCCMPPSTPDCPYSWKIKIQCNISQYLHSSSVCVLRKRFQ